MADHTSPLDSGQLLSPDIPMLNSPPPPPHPPNIVNGDGPQQVILVQVNPGEAFTIQRDDGQFQCITGPAQVPMMSPNGSVPQIYVPPGYVQQIIEENGVRRVLVLPQTEFHPGGHSPLHHPPPPPPHAHLQAFIPHPHIMHPPPPLYSGMAGDMNPQYISQYHPAHTTIYSEQDTHPPHGRASFAHRDERASKTYERLQKKLKERQGVGGGGGGGLALSKDSPPPSPQKSRGTPPSGGDLQNGLGGKGAEEQAQPSTAVTVLGKSPGKGKETESGGREGELDEEAKALQERLNSICKPVVTDIQARGASLSWVAPSRTEGDDEPKEGEEGPAEPSFTYEVSVSYSGKDGKYKSAYSGAELSATLQDLRPATDYHVIAYNAEGKSNPSGVSEFTTAPDRPGCPYRLTVKGKPHPTSFRLTWDPPKDNGGSDVTKYVMELSEGLSGSSWNQVYSGSAMECVCDGLSPGCSYQARVHCISAGGESPLTEPLQVQTPPVPPGPCQPPRVIGKPKAREVQLRWAPPLVDGGSAVSLYSVEMFAPQVDEGREVYQGSELDCTVGSLLPGRTYSFRLRAANKAGYGPFSERSEVTTGPGAPEACRPPHVTCKSPTCAVISWEAPSCNGAAVSEYRLEWGAAEGSMQMCYTGAALSHEMRGLLPATNYFCRVQAVNIAGLGPFSDAVLSQTPCSVPAPVSSVHALRESEMRVEGSRTTERGEDEEDEEDEEDRPLLYSPSTCLGLRWEAPCDHGSEITSYLIDLGERQPILTGPVTKYIIQNLQPDTTYRIRIQALNSLGAGPFSHTFKLKTKPLPPLPPRLECTASSHQTLRLKWGDGPAKAQPTDSLQYHLQMEDKNGRFISLYKGPCHTHKVQRLNESTSYAFRIQAFNEAGEGPFSAVYTFTTPRSPPAPLKAPRVERVDELCEVSWETQPSMKGDPVIYCLQSMQGNSEFKQIYKGSATFYQLPNLSSSTEYRFRVCAIRQCQDAPEIIGPYSSTVILLPPRVDTPGVSGATGSKTAEAQKPKRSLTDEQFSFLIIALLAVTSILIAVAIQYFVIE
ncbi:fibronectin type-III domain-containing 3A-like protein [Labeo rohita]|uniref:Fibronectin type-III domain-containing 3A-like protein n=1 Tax=Labeo rohita TaxID=84645 RepID=A0A498L7I4_LABRO|nr:fibronectin type-III domain-containing 3A-like protein [Labeo rohita]